MSRRAEAIVASLERVMKFVAPDTFETDRVRAS